MDLNSTIALVTFLSQVREVNYSVSNPRDLNELNFTRVVDDDAAGKRCNACDVDYSSEYCKHEHLNGRRHRETVSGDNTSVTHHQQRRQAYKQKVWQPVKK